MQRAVADSPTKDPADVAQRVVRMTDREIGDWPPRWSLRRVWERIQHDEILSGLFGGLTGWAVAAWIGLMAYTVLVLVGVL